MRIAVISDIHAVASAYERALEDARREGFDLLIILGDLLTYGTDPVRSLELTREAMTRDGAVLISGNHDQIYFDLAEGGSPYVDRLPDWIRESIEWNWSQVAAGDLARDLVWREEYEVQGVLIAHANPFGYADWTYLNSDERMEEACAALAARGHRAGVFGHTHRFRTYSSDTYGVSVATVGSVGQPREKGAPVSQWCMIEATPSSVSASPRVVDVDWNAHRAAIQTTSMSQATKDRLCQFFLD